MNYARAALLPLAIRCLLRLSFLVEPRTPLPAKRKIKTKRSPKQTKKTTNEVTSAGTQQVLARVTYGPAAAAPSSTHVRKSSPPSAASGVGVHGLPGPLFVESTAPKSRIHVPRRPDDSRASTHPHLWTSRRGSELHTCAEVISSKRSVWRGGPRASGPALRRVHGSQGVEFMCRDDPKVVRYSHATDGGILATVDVKPLKHKLQLC